MCVSSFPPVFTGQAYRLVYRPGTGRNGLACWLALPRYIAPDAPPLVAIHGIRRGAELQARLFGQRAAALGRPVIAPLFDKASWPRYQQAVLAGRADLALLDLLSSLRRDGIVSQGKAELFGFSGGAQFVHRFAMLHPDHVARLSIASPGWYTFPDDTPYPYGLAPRSEHADDWIADLKANLEKFLALPMNVCVGEADCLPDKNTRRGAMIDAQQGLNRMVRAERWTHAIRTRAVASGIASKIKLHVLRGCGHDFASCVTHGGLDRIVITDALPEPAAPTCRGTCSAQQRLSCQPARSFEPAELMEASE